MDLQDINQAVLSFLNGDYPIKSIDKLISLQNFREPAKLQLVKDTILKEISNCDLQHKIKIAAVIDDAFHTAKAMNDVKINQRIKDLKACFCQKGGNTNWKDALLGLRVTPVFDKGNKYYFPLSFHPNVAETIQFDKSRFQSLTLNNDQISSYGLVGSTFATNKSYILTESQDNLGNHKPTHVLDAMYAVQLLDREKQVDGVAIAVGDGCGGHFGTEEQDKAIASTAYYACRHSVRLISAYLTAEDLLRDISFIVEYVKKEIERKYVRNSGVIIYKEGTTLACGRTFKQKDGSFRFIGFSIGDSMIGAWDPITKTWQTIAPARVQVFREGQTATAIFPTSYKLDEIHTIDCIVSKDTILIPLTDGVYDHLPCIRKRKTSSDNSITQKTVVDDEKIKEILAKKPCNTAQACIQTLAEYAIASVEKQRKQELLESEQAAQEIAKLDEQKTSVSNLDTLTPEQKKLQREELERLHSKKQIQLGDDFSLFGVCLMRKSEDTSSTSSSTSTCATADAKIKSMS